jgi:hypothetical protein
MVKIGKKNKPERGTWPLSTWTQGLQIRPNLLKFGGERFSTIQPVHPKFGTVHTAFGTPCPQFGVKFKFSLVSEFFHPNQFLNLLDPNNYHGSPSP